MSTDTITGPKDFSKRALKKLIIGILGFVLMAGLFLIISLAGYMPGNPFMLIPAAIPFVYFCVGVIELLTGRPFQQLADAWMALRGWQRGVIGTLIVVVAGFLVIFLMAALLMWVK